MINHQDAKSVHPIDYPDVLERIGGDTAFLGVILETFFVEFQEKKARVEEALGCADFIHLQEIGHSLKGASANLGLPFLRRAAAELEAAGREKNIESATRALNSLVTECRVLQDFLKRNPPEVQSL